MKYLLSLSEIAEIIKDVQETADKEFSDDDIRMAIERVSDKLQVNS